MTRRTVAALGLSACVALVAGACGSTVKQQTAVVSNGTDAAGGAQPGELAGESVSEVGADGGTGSTSATAGGGGGAGLGGTGGAGGTTSVGSQTTRTTKPGTKQAAPVKAGDLHIGVVYTKNTDQAISSAGGSGSVVDFKRAYEAVIADLNARGGLLGRRVVAHYRPFDSYGDGNTQESALCQYFTKDQPVFVVLGFFRHTDAFYTCMERAGRAFLEAGGGALYADERLFQEYPHAAVAGALTMSRYVRILVDELVGQGFLDGSSKIGIFGDDTPVTVRVIDDHLLPALARHGFTVDPDHIALVKHAQSVGDHTDSSTQAAVFAGRFKNDGVNRVIPLNLPFEFMIAADRNLYTPRYAISTQNSPDWLAANPSLAPADQLKGSVGLGWSPFADVMGADDTQKRPALDRCFALLKAKGVPMNVGDRLWELSAAGACDNVWVFEEAVKAGGNPVSIDSFIKGLEALGDRVQLATLPSARWGPGRHDGVSTVRLLRYVENCGPRACYRYTSGPKPV